VSELPRKPEPPSESNNRLSTGADDLSVLRLPGALSHNQHAFLPAEPGELPAHAAQATPEGLAGEASAGDDLNHRRRLGVASPHTASEVSGSGPTTEPSGDFAGEPADFSGGDALGARVIALRDARPQVQPADVSQLAEGGKWAIARSLPLPWHEEIVSPQPGTCSTCQFFDVDDPALAGAPEFKPDRPAQGDGPQLGECFMGFESVRSHYACTDYEKREVESGRI